MSQIPLIKSYIKQEKRVFEVCKEGITFLRNLKNKKLRIVFNVTYHSSVLQSFNSSFLNEHANSTPQKEQQCNRLTISKHHKSLSNDRVILIMTAYQQQGYSPQLLVLGYLSASVVLYHHLQDTLTVNSNITQMLSSFKDLLSNTNIDELNKQIKFKSGFAKHPYFLCIFYDDMQAGENKDSFKEFFKFGEGKDVINKVVDTLIDYFPERSSIILKDKELIKQIGKEYESTIIGREIFNFQFSGSTLQNLCFEFCQAFNSEIKIDLLKMYQKIITNQKSRIQDLAIQAFIQQIQKKYFYKNRIILQSHANTSLPVSDYELLTQIHDISDQVLKASMQNAINCMNLSQYYEIYIKIKQKIEKKSKELIEFNKQKNQQLCLQCYQILQQLPIEQNSQTPVCDLIQNIFKVIQNKIQLYQNECLQIISGEQYTYSPYNTYFAKLINGCLQKLRKYTVETVDKSEYLKRSSKLQADKLKYEFKVMLAEKKKLQNEYQVQNSIILQYKSNIHQLNMKKNQSDEFQKTSNSHIFTKETNALRKEIEELKEELADKNIQNQQLIQIIERYEGLKDKQKLKFKFSKELSEMIKEINSKVNKYYDLIQTVKDVNKSYEQIKKKLMEEREVIVNEKKVMAQEEMKRKSQLDRVIKEKSLLEDVYNEAKSAIHVMKVVEQQFKESINDLEKRCCMANCLIADTQGMLEQYKKSITLLVEVISKGKSENLAKFIRTIKDEELKNALKTIIKK